VGRGAFPGGFFTRRDDLGGACRFGLGAAALTSPALLSVPLPAVCCPPLSALFRRQSFGFSQFARHLPVACFLTFRFPFGFPDLIGKFADAFIVGTHRNAPELNSSLRKELDKQIDRDIPSAALTFSSCFL
jgi:hypothetical protein